MILDVGRVCMKVKGKNAGNYCVIVEKPEKNMVTIEGRDIEKTKVNILHIEPMPTILKIGKSAKRDEIIKALEKEGY
jgi:large subunit ribosomal protein L14e